MSIRLSICIPTYNRGSYIAETLRSIFGQMTDEVEIIISDNASNDETQRVIEELCRDRRDVTYFRWPQNMGADRNFLKVIELARGEYCWFLGSDDKIESDGISTILARLAANPNLAGISTGVASYDQNLDKRIYTPPPTRFTSDHLFTDGGDCFSTLGAWFGFISAQIVHRQSWNEVIAKHDLTPYYNAYVHIYVIARMLQAKPKWLYSDHPSVGWRSGNDSFLSEGIYKRLAIDVLGYERIAGDVFGRPSKPYDDVMLIVATVHVKSALLGAKAKNAPASFFWRAFKLCLSAYWRYPKFWLSTVPVFLMPRFVYVAVRAVYRLTLKQWRLRRLNLQT